MHWTLVTTCYLVAWAMAAGPWRLGSVALVAAWMVAQAWFCVTGEDTPVLLYYVLDVLVIAAVLHLRTSVLDWCVIALFPLEWWAYNALSGAERWWMLWALSSAQMILAGPWPWLQRGIESVSHGSLRAGGIQEVCNGGKH